MDLISTRLNSKMFIVRMMMGMTMTVIILAIRTCVDITALNGSYLDLQPKNHWSWEMFYKNLVKYLQWSGDWKKYDHYDTVAVYRMVKSFWRSCQASHSPILRHHHPLTWKHKHEKGWLFKWKFFNHQHLTFITVTFLPSEFLTKSRNNPTKLQVTCPSWLWLCASIMQSIL